MDVYLSIWQCWLRLMSKHDTAVSDSLLKIYSTKKKKYLQNLDFPLFPFLPMSPQIFCTTHHDNTM